MKTIKISQDQLVISPILTKQAALELIKMGITSVVCPKCNEKPTLTKTLNDERTIVSCKCRYILSIDINL